MLKWDYEDGLMIVVVGVVERQSLVRLDVWEESREGRGEVCVRKIHIDKIWGGGKRGIDDCFELYGEELCVRGYITRKHDC